ncbi:hypothetical protein [Synechococcus elongatus]|uniref:Uncharacterized protein n=1 Tax=Synechococcus elongatus PCC 11802 TaxID=2283154 RepID=A0AAT9JSH9_SYNEL|nr:hypothetical protein [Synechococcus elongatus]QFZ92170.1 hypothetical protein EKO22_07130 [Synechococcus elongatus PCC 11802]
MSKFINSLSDQNAQEVFGGWFNSTTVKQYLYSPIKSEAISGASADAANISLGGFRVTQIAKPTANSTATSIVYGPSVNSKIV